MCDCLRGIYIAIYSLTSRSPVITQSHTLMEEVVMQGIWNAVQRRGKALQLVLERTSSPEDSIPRSQGCVGSAID